MKTRLDMEIELPRGPLLKELLQLSNNVVIDDLLEKSLLQPLDHLLARPRKNLRAALVDLGVSIATEHRFISKEQVEKIAKDSRVILEILHTGSLVIDDIQDGSKERRGAPAVHILFGLPVALNAGNWMYFLPFRIVKGMDVSEKSKLQLADELQSILLRAHYGQALDVGTDFTAIAQERIPDVSSALMELKTGALSELASKIGAIACEANANLIQTLAAFGRKFGIALQMFDDVGNAFSEANSCKWSEDIRLRRVSFVISTAARILSPDNFKQMKLLLEDSQDHFLQLRKFLIDHGVKEEAKLQAQLYLAAALSELQANTVLTTEQFKTLERLQQRLMNAYE